MAKAATSMHATKCCWMEGRKACSSFISSSLLLFECKNIIGFNLNSEINLAGGNRCISLWI